MFADLQMLSEVTLLNSLVGAIITAEGFCPRVC